MPKPIVFISYSHDDREKKDQLVKHLKVLEDEFKIWVDDKIWAGDKWENKIDEAMGEASMAILLISASFLTSGFINTKEVPTFLQHRQEDGMIVFPVIAESCAWSDVSWLSSIQARPKDNLAVWREGGKFANEELTKIVKETKALLKKEKNKDWPTFQNRKDELDRLLDNFTVRGGERFYLLISAPKMGKTWFLDELTKKLLETDRVWKIVRKNLFELDRKFHDDGVKLLSACFGLDFFDGNEEDLVRSIAHNIISDENYSYILMIDHAELLNDTLARQLRDLLSKINDLLDKSGAKNSQLGFVASSRSEIKSWNGVIPFPRFHKLVLTHFKKKVIENALEQMAEKDRRDLGKNWSTKTSIILDEASEGLPALLTEYMGWIRKQQYTNDIDEICSLELFEQIAVPYVNKELLSPDSFLPFSTIEGLSEGDRSILNVVLKTVLLRLSSYRKLSESHLKENLGDLEKHLEIIGWGIRDLWNVLSRTYFIKPSENIWHEIYPSIRRLLFRYQYRDTVQQKKAHEEAYSFLGEWWQEISGTDRSIYLIENLWHFVEIKRLSKENGGEEDILEYVDEVFRKALKPNHNTVGDLARYTITLLSKDEKLQLSMAEIDSNLFDKTLKIIEVIDEENKL